MPLVDAELERSRRYLICVMDAFLDNTLTFPIVLHNAVPAECRWLLELLGNLDQLGGPKYVRDFEERGQNGHRINNDKHSIIARFYCH